MAWLGVGVPDNGRRALESRSTSLTKGAFALVLLAQGVPAAASLTATADGRTETATALTDHVLRVTITAAGHPAPDSSWVVAGAKREARADSTVAGNTLKTSGFAATLDPHTLRLTVADAQGHVILADAPVPLDLKGDRFTLYKALGQGEHIFAQGDKTGLLDRRGGSFVDWNTDAWGFGSSTDPIYKSIPFFVSSGGAGGAYGVFLDNTWRSWFDFGHRRADTLEFGAENGPIDYYVIAGPTIRDVVRRYADLTGHAPLPPRWALGYQQSRWSYGSEAEVRALADKLRAEHFPTDVIWLDIDYQDRDRPFTIDRKAFPHFEQMVADLKKQGITIVNIVDLHIAHAPDQGYKPYDEGMAQDRFVHNPDGSAYVAPVWPGPAVFPEFTQASTRKWWGTLFKPFTDAGSGGIWNDMNEPAIFDTPTKTMPLDVVDRIEGDGFSPRTATQAEIHNVFGMENSRATYEGLRTLRPDERAFVMTRASFAGGQRYAATWTGDNSSTWDHLKLSVEQTLNLGLSGFTWAGADVGGFTGGPSPELMTRWFEYATFAPIFRDHSAKDAPRAEPWVDGPEQLAIRRSYVDERYKLMPYFYAVAEASARTGDPFMRPVFYDYPQVMETPCNASMSFTVGARLLVAGNPRPEDKAPYQACLPAGGWFDYWTGKAAGGKPSPDGRYDEITLTPRLDRLPAFVRAGTILPRQPLVQSTLEAPRGPLSLDVYPGPDCHGELYDDDGHSMGFTRGDFARQEVSCATSGGKVNAITFAPRQGSYRPWWREIRVTIHGGAGYAARLDGKALAVSESDGDAQFTIPDRAKGATVNLVLAD
ncbi:MAG: DUF5110 domain-containing protein [Sphingomonadales bacterium]|nr:DUF5110 domain-containing protein [Sphingomonadales bacterium]MDE2569188.1 DUF5110 domain-containing protein [Sphingomonadales bacterium]